LNLKIKSPEKNPGLGKKGRGRIKALPFPKETLLGRDKQITVFLCPLI